MAFGRTRKIERLIQEVIGLNCIDLHRNITPTQLYAQRIYILLHFNYCGGCAARTLGFGLLVMADGGGGPAGVGGRE